MEKRKAILLLFGVCLLCCDLPETRGRSLAQGTVSGGRAGEMRPQNIVIITIDTLRADRLTPYGYQKIQTPNIARLARDGVLFENTVSPVPLTLPSHCSIFTGTYPAYHGVRDHSGFALSGEIETMASRLKSLGFATGAFVGSFVLDSRFGLDRGFDFYHDRFDTTRSGANSAEGAERTAEQVAREAMRWMQSQAGRRFFAWLHFYDPHAPYAPPEPFKSNYASDPYDGEVAYTDSVVGEILSFARREKWYEESLVILTSDHGEDLGDHGENTHGFFVYDSTVRVPLILKLPGGWNADRRVATQVRSIDIFPTILQILKAPPIAQTQGRGLLSTITTGTPRSAEDALGETYYPYYHFGWSPLLFIRTGRYKYIDAPRPELYDLLSDPGETRNIEGSEKALAGQLRDRLRAGYARYAVPQPHARKDEADPVTLEKLRSLGYITYSSRDSRAAISAGLPDPKKKLYVYNLVQQAQLQRSGGQPQESVRRYREILAREPRIIDARIQLGLLYKKMGDYALAIQEFKLALEVDSSNAVAAYNLAHSCALSGRLDEAILGFTRTLQLDPREVRARTGLGIAYQMRGSLLESAREYQAALALDPDETNARNNLASIYLAQRDPAKALAELRRSLESDSRRAETHNLMGSALWLDNDPVLALAEFKEAISLDRKFLDAYLNLGMLLSSLRRAQEALGYLRTAAELAPRSARVFQILGEAYRSAGLDADAEKAFARSRELSIPR